MSLSGSKLKYLAVTLYVIFCTSSIYVSISKAATPGGRSYFYGYFLNQFDDWGSSVLPNYVNGGVTYSNAIPNYVNSVSDFVTLLQNQNKSKNTQASVGSAFIVNLMLYKQAPGSGSTTVSSTDWSDLTSRLNALSSKNQISWNATASSCINSIYQGSGSGSNPQDDTFYDNGGSSCKTNQPAIVMYNDSGQVIFTLLRACANPFGNITPLPHPNWSLSGNAVPDKTIAKVGDTINWSYYVYADAGPTPSTQTIQTNYQDGGLSTASGNFGSVSPSTPASYGVPVVTKVNFRSVVATSVGQYCSAVYIPNYSSGETNYDGSVHLNNGAYTSPRVCVPVTATGSALPDVCRPITYSMTAATYPALNNGHVYTSAYTPDYTASTNVYSDTTVYSGSQIWQTIPLTTNNTDGMRHDVLLTDVRNHASSLVTYYHYPLSQYQTRYVLYYDWSNWYYTYSTTTQPTLIINSYEEQKATSTTDPVTNVTTWVVYTRYKNVPVYSSWSGWMTYRMPYDSTSSTDSLPPNTPTAQYQYTSSPVPTYAYTIVMYSDGTSSGRYYSGLAANSTSNNGAVRTFSSAIGPCYDYLLSDSVAAFSTTKKSAGDSVNIIPNIVDKSFTQTYLSAFYSKYQTISKSKLVDWQVNMITLKPGEALPSNNNGGESAISPCPYYGYNTAKCTTIFNGKQQFSTGSSSINNLTYTLPDAFAGTKYCFTFSIQEDRSDPSNHSDSPDPGPWYHSALNPSVNCLLVVKKPKVQVLGGDLSVGVTLPNSGNSAASIETSQSSKNGTIYGSWVEYGVFASGGISGLASGSTLNGGSNNASVCSLSPLTFANSSGGSMCNGYLGHYGFSSDMKNLLSYFNSKDSVGTLSGTVSATSLSSGLYNVTGNINISGGIINGSTVIYAPNSDVTISGDINYNQAVLTNIAAISQLVIIAKDINVTGNVANIDAWLSAPSGYINTCSDVSTTSPLTVFTCSNQLKITGPVYAKDLYLRRTAGSDPGSESGAPAEILNLSPDAYLWMYHRSLGDNRLRTTYVTELPPRL